MGGREETQLSGAAQVLSLLAGLEKGRAFFCSPLRLYLEKKWKNGMVRAQSALSLGPLDPGRSYLRPSSQSEAQTAPCKGGAVKPSSSCPSLISTPRRRPPPPLPCSQQFHKPWGKRSLCRLHPLFSTPPLFSHRHSFDRPKAQSEESPFVDPSPPQGGYLQACKQADGKMELGEEEEQV